MQVKNLRSYLANINMTMAEFAELIGYQKQYISSVAVGSCRPSIKLANIIKKATNGVVDLTDIPRPLHKQSKAYKEQQKAQAGEG